MTPDEFFMNVVFVLVGVAVVFVLVAIPISFIRSLF